VPDLRTSVLPGGVAVDRFRFLDHGYDPSTGEAKLAYGFDDGEPLVERIRFSYGPWPQDPSRQAVFNQALALLHLVAGVSYYKACVPPAMDTGAHHLGREDTAFLDRLYIEGLAEFAYHNELELEGRVHFPATGDALARARDLDLPDRALVAMGGGKDSLVALEMLRDAGIEVQPVCVGDSELIGDTVQAAGLPLIRIGRALAPGLRKMNKAGALNGHVPVTAIHSAILLCAAVLYGYRWVVMANEASADEETLRDDRGRPVNHQYSKSLAFERGLRAWVRRRLSPGIDYFSLLRPLKEIAVANRFARLTRYHQVFSSCNRNFHLDGPRITARWCGDCPKCRFTALALAPFMEPGEIQAFMGADLLGDPAQEEGFRALCRLGVDKPFECVGTVEECRAAMLELGRRESWKDKAVVRALAAELAGPGAPPLDTLLAGRGEHCIPAEVAGRVDL